MNTGLRANRKASFWCFFALTGNKKLHILIPIPAEDADAGALADRGQRRETMKPIFTNETPLERLQRRLEQDELRRERKPVTLPAFWSIRSDQILEGVAQ